MRVKKKLKNVKNFGVKSKISLDYYLNSNDYNEKYMKIKFNSDDEIPLKKMIEIPSMIIIVRAVLHENNKYYPQVFLDECLYKL